MPCALQLELRFCGFTVSESQGSLDEVLLARCLETLRPLLNLPRADTSPDGILEMEACLGDVGFFDALTHLAVLASSHLRLKLEQSNPCFEVEMIDEGSMGLSASIAPPGHVTARELEMECLNHHIRPVFESSFDKRHCPLIVVFGLPGTGKSFLTDHVLSRLENQFKAREGESCWENVEEYSCKFQARGRDAVRDGLHKMGLALCAKLDVGSSASADDILGSNSKPRRLHDFLLEKRFVIVADDCDTQGCTELLYHVPQSTKPCCLILTSMFGFDIISQLEGSFRKSDLVCVHLESFTPKASLQLVNAFCNTHDYTSFCAHQLNWLTQVLEQLGQLPLAVQLFAHWLHQVISQGTVHVADLKDRWAREYAGDSGRVLGPVVGIRATVRDALHKLKSCEECKECMQVLGLLALCPPVQVPWSLFDGLSLMSAMGLPCQVRREDDDGGVFYDDAVVASDEIIKGGESVCVQLQNGNQTIVSRSSIAFGPHIIGMVVKNEQYQVQLLTPQPYMRGARVYVEDGTKTSNGLLGRVLQYHDDDCTVSVVFGCETGASCMLASIALCLTFVQAR